MLRGVSGTWTEPQTFEDSTIFAHSIDITGSTGLILENDETITNSTDGLISLSGNLAIPNGGTIGTASDTDSITIASAGAVTFSQGVTITGAVDIQGGYANGGGAPYDGVVDEGGGGNWTTAQAGDDDLDAGSYSMLIKAGTYTTLTVSTANAYIFVEAGTIFTGAIVLSGAGVTLECGPGCDFRGLITLSGNGNRLVMGNACDTDGLLLSGNSCFHDGGGWDTLHDGATANDAIQITGTDCIVQNCSAQTTAGEDNDVDGVSIEGARTSVLHVKVVDADERGIHIPAAGAVDSLIEGCTVLGADANGIDTKALRTRIIGNYIIAAGNDGIQVGATGDDSVITGNIVKDQATQAIDINTNGENCVIVGNRVDDLGTSNGVVDNSGTSTATGNDETAF